MWKMNILVASRILLLGPVLCCKNQTRILSVSLKVGSRRRRIGEESTTKRFLALLNTDIIQLNSHRLLFTKEAITSISRAHTQLRTSISIHQYSLSMTLHSISLPLSLTAINCRHHHSILPFSYSCRSSPLLLLLQQVVSDYLQPQPHHHLHHHSPPPLPYPRNKQRVQV